MYQNSYVEKPLRDWASQEKNIPLASRSRRRRLVHINFGGIGEVKEGKKEAGIGEGRVGKKEGHSLSNGGGVRRKEGRAIICSLRPKPSQ